MAKLLISVVWMERSAVLLRQGFGGHPSPGSVMACHPKPRYAAKDGGANRDRTDDLKLAKLALSQLSYGPDWC